MHNNYRQLFSIKNKFSFMILLFIILTSCTDKTDYSRYELLWQDPVMRYNAIAKDYLENQDFKMALKFYKKSLKISPDYPEILIRTGLCYANLGKYNKALKDYNKALKLTQRYPFIYLYRGTSYLFLKKFELAIDDYNKLLQIESGIDISTYYLYMLYCYTKYDKKLYFDFLSKLKNKKPREIEWYSMLIDYLADDVSADDLLTIANNNEEKLCEFYFYTGMKKAVEGKKKEAKEYYQKCYDTKITDFIEYSMAELEL